MMKPTKAVILFSGGLDSTTLLYHVQDKEQIPWEDILALGISYGQKHEKENERARKIAYMCGCRYLRLDLRSLFEYFPGSSLIRGSSEEIPKESYKEGELPSTYVPFRNGVFLSVAASIAAQKFAPAIYYGAHRDDFGAAYPDCSESFVTNLGQAIHEGTARQVELRAPFISWTKADIVKEGLRLRVPFDVTWSCYRGGIKPCGTCATCVDRAKAFAANGYVEEEGRLIPVARFHE